MKSMFTLLAVGCLALMTSSSASNDDVIRRKRADDVDLVALQTLVQQQASSIQQLQSQLTASNQLLTTTRQEVSTLKASLPSFAPVAFSVGFNADDGTNGLPLSPHALLHFDRVITNVGNGYSTATGMFTAPVTGVYSFYISFMSVNGVSYTRIGIVKNGVLLDYAFADGQAVYDRGSTQVAVHLAKGDTVWAREEGGPAVRGGPYTIFTGFLVQAD